MSENLTEAPLGYWEEKSYMLVLSKDITEVMPQEIFKRISSIEGVEIKEQGISEEGIANVKLTYENEEFEVGFYPSGFEFAPIYISNSFYYFSEKEIERIQNTKDALTMFMGFNKDAKKSFHLQLKLAVAIAPNLIGVLDESAEKMLPSRWVMMAANSNVVPSSNDLYTVQAVSHENGEVWLHTHGLCRCGLTELEILQSDVENYNNHYNLISTFASFLIDKKGEFNPYDNMAFIGLLVNREPVVVTCRSWTTGLNEYKDLSLGSIEDRREAHNSRTSIIFIYKSEEDANNKKISKVSEYNNLWGENPIFFISDEETARMKALAMERFHFVENAAKDEKNKVIIKIGLTIDSGNDFEHIWFELLNFEGDKFKAKLLQEPYNVKSMHEGDEAYFTVKDVTDWTIYTPEIAVTPSNAYVLIK